jgi:hypothetical protein
VFRIRVIGLSILLSTHVAGQIEPGTSDSIPRQSETAGDTIIKVKKKHSPQKAAWLSLAIPGAGQVYNRKYWKVIPVYAALGATIYFAMENHREYRTYADAFDQRVAHLDTNINAPPDQFIDTYDPTQLINLQNTYRQDRDLMIILAVLSYALQIVDAYVDAHLFHYDISDDLTFNWEPVISSPVMGFNNMTAGLRFSLTFDHRKKTPKLPPL